MKLQTYPPGYDTGEEQVTLSDLQSHARTLLAVVREVATAYHLRPTTRLIEIEELCCIELEKGNG